MIGRRKKLKEMGKRKERLEMQWREKKFEWRGNREENKRGI